MIDAATSRRLYARAEAARWRVEPAEFGRALAASADKAFAGREPSSGELGRYLSGLHLTDLALAVACGAGDEDAWRHFVTEFRPVLYRSADAIDPTGGARDIADGLYADLFGLKAVQGERQPLFRYFHGRSSLATWLRAVLAQRHVDRVRSQRRSEALPGDEQLPAPVTRSQAEQLAHSDAAAMMRSALAEAMASLEPKDRLRLACYYARRMTLAQIGRLTAEHEATVSRQLARTRTRLREQVEVYLTRVHGLDADQVDACFRMVADDSGPLDLGALLDSSAEPRKNSAPDRSRSEKP
jgi:RNA polymerase sigma-70 factor